jgi:putative DNA primase/helicase
MDNTNMVSNALKYAEWGWAVFPLIGKRPLTGHGFKDASTNPETIRAWWAEHPQANIGLAACASHLVLIDLDNKDGRDGITAWEKLKADNGFSDDWALKSITGGYGQHLIFTAPEGIVIPNTTDQLAPGIEIKASSGYIVLPPSIHPNGNEYLPMNRWNRKPGPVPFELLQLIMEKEPQPAALPQVHPAPAAGRTAAYAETALANELNLLAGTAPGGRNRQLFKSAAALGQIIAAGWLERGRVEAELLQVAVAIGLTERESLNTIASGVDTGSTTPRVIKEVEVPLQQTEPRPSETPTKVEAAEEPKEEKSEWLDADLLINALKRGETGDAEILAQIFQDKIAFDHAEGTWFLWDGQNWNADETGQITGLITSAVFKQYVKASEQAMRQADMKKADELNKNATRLCNRNRISNVLELAGRQPGIGITGNEWDSNPWLLGVRNGVIDLHTGEFRPGAPKDYIRSVTSTPYQKDTDCPRFKQFLREIFSDDADLCAYIQRLFGYGITGLTDDHVFPIFWGGGRNGKDTLLETLASVLGTHIASPVAESIVVASQAARSSGAPNADLMSLRGLRLCWVSETEESARLNVAQVKKLTGGGQITARAPYGRRNVTFMPGYLILLLTNHKPTIPADDNAIWMRVNLIPFNETFKDNPDPNNPHEHPKDARLREKMVAEAPGILNWLIQGCLEWQRIGLNPPEAIRAATEEYKRDEDIMTLFIEECCVVDKKAFVETSELLNEYNKWAESYGMRPLGIKTFSQRISKRFDSGRNPNPENRRKGFFGIGLVTKEDKK